MRQGDITVDSSGDFYLIIDSTGLYKIECKVCGKEEASGRETVVKILWEAMIVRAIPTHHRICKGRS